MALFIRFHEHLLTSPYAPAKGWSCNLTHSTSGAKTASTGCELLTYTAFQGWRTANENFLRKENLTAVGREGGNSEGKWGDAVFSGG